MIAEILLALFVIVTLSWFPYYAWCDLDLKSIKGPIAFPFIGTMRNFLTPPDKVFAFLGNRLKTYGKTTRFYLLTRQNLFTIDTDFIEFLSSCSSTINKGNVYKFLYNWLGQGLLTSSGRKWHTRRKMITPAYHFKVLDQFMEIFDRNSNIMVDKLRKEDGQAQTDIYPYVNLCALDVICETSMGTQVNAQKNSESAYVGSIKKMNRIIFNRAFSMLKTFDFTYSFTEDYKLEQECLKVVHGYTDSVIKSRREELANTTGRKTRKTSESDEFYTKRKDNFLDLLLKSTINGVPLTDAEIREEVDTFTFEGHDTVSSGISFALFAISNNPDIQERLIEEQRSIFGSNPSRAITLNDVADMKYLDMVIKETMRLYPTVPIIARSVSEDVKYKDMQLRKGSQVSIFVYELHRDPDNFPEPLKFDPDRFLPENSAGRHPFAYIPFSAGHRNCIGQKFALLEMKATISKVLRNYELFPLQPVHEPIFLPEIVLRPENGMLLRVQKRAW